VFIVTAIRLLKQAEHLKTGKDITADLKGVENSFYWIIKNLAYLPSIKKRIVDMALNGSGIRDTARVLSVNMNTVMSTLKKNLAN